MMYQDILDYENADSRVGLATAYAVSKATTARLEALVKLAAKDGAPIAIPGGTVGYHVARQREAKDGAHLVILQRWLKMDDAAFMAWRNANGDVANLLHVIGVSSGAVDDVAKAMYPYTPASKETYKADRAELADACLTVQPTVKFGIEKVAPKVNGDGDTGTNT